VRCVPSFRSAASLGTQSLVTAIEIPAECWHGMAKELSWRKFAGLVIVNNGSDHIRPVKTVTAAAVIVFEIIVSVNGWHSALRPSVQSPTVFSVFAGRAIVAVS